MLRRRQAAEPASHGGPVIDGLTELVPIGRGGFSTVYRARQPEFDNVVAVKVLDVGIDDHDARRRFERECLLIGRLRGHPNVVRVFAAGFTTDGRPYLVMEHLGQGSLHDRLQHDGTLQVPEVLRIGVRIAGALASAHAAGIVHRDVKPGNILVSDYGEPALADFGIGGLAEIRERSMTVDGLTPVHAAPEVLEGNRPGEAADVWSLGSTLHTLLAGAPPFAPRAGEGPLPFMLRVLSEPQPHIARPDVPPELVAALAAAMAKQPDERPSMEQLGRTLQDVERALGQPVTDLAIAAPQVDDATGRSMPEEGDDDEHDTVIGAAPRPGAAGAGADVPESGTRLRDRGFRPPPKDAAAPPPPRRWPAIALSSAVVGGLALASFFLFGGDGGDSDGDGDGAAPPSTDAGGATTAAPTAFAADEVPGDPTKVRLTWQNQPGQQPYLLVVSQGEDPDAQEAVPLAATESSILYEVDPAQPYCFTVGHLADAGGDAASIGIEYADWQCIRGMAEPVLDGEL